MFGDRAKSGRGIMSKAKDWKDGKGKEIKDREKDRLVLGDIAEVNDNGHLIMKVNFVSNPLQLRDWITENFE
jgi:hypothetical protein